MKYLPFLFFLIISAFSIDLNSQDTQNLNMSSAGEDLEYLVPVSLSSIQHPKTKELLKYLTSLPQNLPTSTQAFSRSCLDYYNYLLALGILALIGINLMDIKYSNQLIRQCRARLHQLESSSLW